jgi:hypothetical protein
LAAGPLIAQSWIPEDCEPKRPCDATDDCSLKVDNRDCSLNVDTRDCNPHWGCDNFLTKPGCELDKVRFRNQCEAAKAGQNAAYAIAKQSCEAAKAQQNALYAIEKANCEAAKTGKKLDCERLKTQERIGCETGLTGPFSCNTTKVLEKLRVDKQGKVKAEWTGAITTPISVWSTHWRPTACAASGIGKVYQTPQHSSDGFWTVDVELQSFEIGGIQKPAGKRYIRLEVKPKLFGGGQAHDFFDHNSLSSGEVVRFQGPVYIDKDGPFLEVHPGDVFEKVPQR